MQAAAGLSTRVQRRGRWTQETVFLISSLTLEELQAAQMLQLKRNYWVIESRLHHCLDISLQEDLSRVRNPNAARLLGTIRRIALSLSNAWVDRVRQRKPKSKATTKSFLHQFNSARGGRQRLHSLIFSKRPAVLDFTT